MLLDANGEGEVRLDFPDFNGELRIVAQAWSEEAYGMAEGSTVVAAPVLVDLAAPHFLAGGDRSQVAVDISNLTDTPQTLRPTLEVDGLLRAEGSLPAEIVLAPGKRSCPYHLHHAQEEMFVILEGEGTLRVAGQMLPVKQGDEVVIPPGPEYPHQFINTSAGLLKYLSISTLERPEICGYPDSNKVAAWHFGLKAMQREGTQLDYWDGEP